jgi:hypothetical protein
MRIEHFGIEDECIKVYDPIKKQLIAIYDTYVIASKKLGLTHRCIKHAAITKSRRFSPILNKEIAIRLASKNK